MMLFNNITQSMKGTGHSPKFQDLAAQKKLPALFYQLGGYSIVEEVVELFYQKALSDSCVNYFFGSNDVRLDQVRMKSFLAKLLGVTAPHVSIDVNENPSPFIKSGMTTDHVVIVMKHFRQSLLDLAVETTLANEVMVDIISSGKESSN